MLKKSTIILLGVGISLLLSSCHIEEKDVETIARTTNSLRIYQANDFIEYNVRATTFSINSTTSLGTLRVQWELLATSLIDPINNSIQYPIDPTVIILKETTTLTYEEGSNETDQVIIRYISQDNNGNVTLYAIDDGTVPLYWLYAPTYPNLSAPTIQPVIFNSPMAVGTNSSVKYSVMAGCGGTPGQCTSGISTVNDDFNIVGETTAITTNLGIFSDPFQIDFEGVSQPIGNSTIAFWAGIYNACGQSDETITHNGAMFVMPEIGMVRMNYLCQNLTSDNVNYTFTINNTNIPLS